YYPLTFLAAHNLCNWAQGYPIKKLTIKLLQYIGGLIGIVLALVPIVGLNKGLLIPLMDDPFAVGNLQAKVPWSYLECLYGVGYLALIWVGARQLRQHFARGMGIILLAQLLAVQTVIMLFTPRIEAYSQRAAIEYYQSFKGCDVYIGALGYKSYAYLFYADKQHFAAPNYYDSGKINEHWLLYGVTDKPVYFITKSPNAAQYYSMPGLEKTGEKNGFVFFQRKRQ
ncbi:MAG: hypothetical protein EBZ77_06820, partial [Chitinophagia bacterium]|nr:hypothetical protein [Chitinophagia bacterium]